MIRQLVMALDEAGVEIDAEAIADALWLARARREDSGTRDQRPTAAGRPAPTEPRPPDAEPRDPVDDALSESEVEPAGSVTARQAGHRPGAGASSITFAKVHALPRTLELGRALRPLKQGHPSKRHRSLNADATVQYFCDTGILTPIMVPGAERWFDVEVLVDAGPSMVVWQDMVAEFVSFLRRHGAFREVRRWNLEQADETLRLSRAADARSEAAQLVNPDARRLIMILTDCIAPMWYQAPIWDAIRGWGQFSPVVVISPLPARLWQGTALGSPEVTMRSHRPGAANRLLDVTLPWWWPDDEPPWPAVPVPVITLEAGQVASWARMTMGAGGAESLGVFAMPPPGSTGVRPRHGRLDAEEVVRRFRVTVSPVAYRLAVALSAVLHSPWGLGLARVVQKAVHPDSDQVHLAEVLVGGLVRQAERPEGREEPVFEFVDGVVDVLQRSMTGTEALRVLEALSGYIERETGKSPGIAALLLGETAPVDATEEFEEVRAGAANLIQAMGLAQAEVAPKRTTEAPDTSDLGESASGLGEPRAQGRRVVPVIGFVDGQRQVGSGYRVAGRFVLTAAHCVRGIEHKVWLPDGEHAAWVVVDGAPEIGLALLEITRENADSDWSVSFAKIAPRLRRSENGEGDYQVDEEMRTIQLLEPGIKKVEDWCGLDNLHSHVNSPLVTYLDKALKAKELFKRDRDYVVMNGEVLMRARSTGQIVYGRRYDEGIHQAIEAKEGVPVKERSQPPVAEMPPTQCARVDRNFSGQIGGCVTIGFPQHAARAEAPATIWHVDGWISISKGQRSWWPRRRRDQTGLLTFKVAGTAPHPLPTSETELSGSAWAGMSGAAVLANGLLIGVVAEHHLPDDSGSLTVVPIEWAERLVSADRARLLQALGLKSVADMDLLTPLPRPGRRLPAVRSADLEARVHQTLLAIPYIHRDAEDAIRAHLRGGRPVLLIGSSMVGKTKMAARVIADEFGSWPTAIPDSKTALADLDAKDITLQHSVIWLDDIDRFIGAGGITAAALQRLAAAGNVIISTIRTSVYERFRPSDQLRPPEWDVLSVFERIFISRDLTQNEQERLARAVSDPEIRDRIRAVGLGEYVGAAGQVAEALKLGAAGADGLGYALVLAAADWRRCGMTRPVPTALLSQLAEPHLDQRGRTRLADPDAFNEGLGWATRDINPNVSLLQPAGTDSYTIYDYALDIISAQDTPIPASSWAVIINDADASELLNVGYAAEATYHRTETAVQALRKATNSRNADTASRAALNLGVLLERDEDAKGARAAYRQAIGTGHADHAPAAMVDLGVLEQREGDPGQARYWYQQAIGTGHPDQAPKGMFNLGALENQQGKPAAARRWFLQAIDSGHPDEAPRAMVNLGALENQQGKPAAARHWFLQAIDSGHADQVPVAAYNLGVLLAGQEDVRGATAAFQMAIDSGHADLAPRAAASLGALLAGQEDVRGARAAFQMAIDSGHTDVAPMAARNLELLEQKKPTL